MQRTPCDELETSSLSGCLPGTLFCNTQHKTNGRFISGRVPVLLGTGACSVVEVEVKCAFDHAVYAGKIVPVMEHGTCVVRAIREEVDILSQLRDSSSMVQCVLAEELVYCDAVPGLTQAKWFHQIPGVETVAQLAKLRFLVVVLERMDGTIEHGYSVSTTREKLPHRRKVLGCLQFLVRLPRSARVSLPGRWWR
ncbi:hypothetical protein CYMTET_38938 [Cymbomonas tetramitiformis]|uniref:Uncharacterized protein n=1 Tax=Cymbomonas tetramitiformis TaxID=36881 RepID=A0AAE0BTJ3_9CHLO|nr:hypothetical protein CYMTET_47836 [Cymbomonas tetramitiformis]KAK3251729.1 hypothetical protein CYMTET_38938 [Cymbomonas tetramitiformis]